MNNFEHDLTQRLAALREQGLFRELRRVESPQSPRIEVQGKTLLNFSSNDYLGLANEPALKEAAIETTRRYGAGAGASRLICGSLAPHHELDEALAAFKGTEAALGFSTGYAAAMGAICALLGKDDFIVLDKLVHACIVDAARLSGATLRVFNHNDLDDLEAKLKWADEKAQGGRARILVVTESVFSMDGDHAPLSEIVALKEHYGAWLMVDEAHASGLYGPRRRGLAEELGIGDRIEVQMGTLGKALGASGGYICGPRTLVDYLVNRARTFIFSTAPVPAAAAAATAGIRFVESNAGEERRNLLWQRVSDLSSPAPAQLSNPGSQPLALRHAIIPIIMGDEAKATAAAAALRDQGIFIPAIRYPTVARGKARLRLTVTAAHTSADLTQLLTAFKSLNFGLRTSAFGL
ncbi:MAG TPA: 8-amino-7-oxononanoate synthase [Candidatus Paceibacterota bacterium]|nr:8-amino-7-oxononanoate synthase [Verrucomicrobiota bacterium]HSA08838.1 8-amino-7-oxononanoate synthase [Candidatus Paceibacterota bacterium]